MAETRSELTAPQAASGASALLVYHRPAVGPAMLCRWQEGQVQRLSTSTELLAEWRDLARQWRQLPRPARVTTPAGEAWVQSFPGPDATEELVVACLADAEVAPDLERMALVGQVVRTQAALASAQAEALNSDREREFARVSAARQRDALPVNRMVNSLARRLQETLGAEVLWLWSNTDLRRRPVVVPAGSDPDKAATAEARRLAETVMTRGQVLVRRGGAGFVAAPLTCSRGVLGALVARLPERPATGVTTELLRELAGYTTTALVASRLQTQRDQEHLSGAQANVVGGSDGLREVVAGLAHELNNALAVVSLRAEIGSDENPSGEAGAQFAGIRQAVGQAAGLVRQLQGAAGARSGAAVTDGQLVDLGELLRDLVSRHGESWREAAALAGVRLEVQVQAEDDLHVHGSDEEFATMILGLLDNAREALSAGGELDVSLSRCDDFAVLRVRDGGAGMPLDVLQRACEPFYTTHPEEHIGLGLTQAQGLCVCHHGRLVLSSEPGRGTTVEAILPLAVPHSTPALRRTAEVRRGRSPEPLLVLVADDDPAVLRMAADGLGRLGHRVRTACDGREALQLLRTEGPFDALLLDLSMPGAGGWEVAGLARRLQPAAAVLLLTGWGEAAATRNDGRLDRVVAKPVALEDLEAALQTCVAQRRATRAKTTASSTAAFTA